MNDSTKTQGSTITHVVAKTQFGVKKPMLIIADVRNTWNMCFRHT